MSEYLQFRLKSSGQRTVVVSFLVAATVALGVVGPATAWADDDRGLKAVPFEFVGTAAQCAPSPAGSRIVTAKWLRGMGLPDNGGQNTTPSDLTTNPNKKDRHSGLLLSKNGPTPDCSSSGARILGVKGIVVTPTFAVGYDYRKGGHCGAGAPRFNIDTNQGFFFVGCANAPNSPAPQDPDQWTRTRSVITTCGSECFPASIPAGSTINSINIIFDEGTDTANNDTEGVGLAVLDNIFINGVLITRGPGKDHHDGKDHGDDDDDDDNKD
ncbi:MAG: hypothetical protein AABM64_18305 [Pseudomonadota bacterium]